MWQMGACALDRRRKVARATARATIVPGWRRDHSAILEARISPEARVALAMLADEDRIDESAHRARGRLGRLTGARRLATRR